MFSQTAEYALRAMSSLALHAGERVSSGQLAEETKVPPDYLAKVLQLLARSGLVAGRRGVGGGYTLTRDPGKIKLIEVVNAVEKIEPITTCPLGLPNHGPNLCPLHKKMDEAARAIIKIFDDVTLAEMLNAPGANVPLCNEGRTAKLTVNRRAVGA
jgi:Rrf2 family protein